jgi:uncharacterized protein (TIGR02246 family)
MKDPYLLVLAGLALSFALPAFAQETNRPDPQLRQQLETFAKKEDEAFNKNDAAAVAALFEEDAVMVTNRGPIYGREAIEKHLVDLFKHVHFSNHTIKIDQTSPHMLGTTDKAWNNGEWSTTVQGHNGALIEMKGYWSSITIHEGDTWKDQLQTFNITPAPAATPSPVTTPSGQ